MVRKLNVFLLLLFIMLVLMGSGGSLSFYGWAPDGSGNWLQQTAGGDIVFSINSTGIRSNTSDGSDNKRILLAGGGAADIIRGGYIELYGNEASAPGAIAFKGGNVATGNFYFDLGNASASTFFRNTSSGTMWSFDNSGNLIQNSTNGGYIKFGADFTGITASTSDGSDNIEVGIGGGGGLGVTRGATLQLGGNEQSGGVRDNGAFQLFAGTSQGNGTIGGYQDIIIQTGTPGPNTGESWRFDTNGTTTNFAQHATNGGDIVFNKTLSSVRAGTSDGSDNETLYFAGGGGTDQTRGAFVRVDGNETNNGGAILSSGDTAGAQININNRAASSGLITFSITSLERWRIDSNGTITQSATNGGDIVLSKADTNVAVPVNIGLTATGTTSSDALVLTKAYSRITTTAAGTGVRLSANTQVGSVQYVTNYGANTLKVYPPTGSAIFGSATDAAITVAVSATAICVRTVAGTATNYDCFEAPLA